MNIIDLRCWFEEFGVRGLGVIRSAPDTIILEFADLTEIAIEAAPLGRYNVLIRADGRDEPLDYRGLDLQGLIGLLQGMGLAPKER